MYINFIVVFYFDIEEMWRNYRFYFWKCVHLYINCKLLLQIGSSFSVFILWTRHIHLTRPAREHSITKRINNLPTHTHTHTLPHIRLHKLPCRRVCIHNNNKQLQRRANAISCCLSFPFFCAADTALLGIQLKFSCRNPPAWSLHSAALLLYVAPFFVGLALSQLLFCGFCYFHSAALASTFSVCKSPLRLSTGQPFDCNGSAGSLRSCIALLYMLTVSTSRRPAEFVAFK